MNLQEAIKAVTEKQDLSFDEMTSVMRLIMTGEATLAQIGGFLIGLRMKGESVDEISGAATVMRELAEKVDVSSKHLVDIVGTGGDSSGTFNVSTASIFVAAAAGASVAKHGNRSVSSKSGAADVLEAAGVNLKLNAAQVAACIEKCGVGFMFAPNHHSAMKHAIGPRKEMGVRTIFNILGPLTNPASAPNQLLGVYDEALLEPMAQVLKKLGSEHVMVVHSEDGLDEISIAAKTSVVELKAGDIKQYTINPEQFGLNKGALADIKVNSAEESLAMIQSAFDGTASAARDIVALNAGAAIYVAGLAPSVEDGVQRALQTMADGSAKAKLAELVSVSNSDL